MLVDLHTHSTASDGQYSPGELVELAKKKGIEVLALTDHDNIDGVEEAAMMGERLGVQVLRGVELSADDYLNLHILGYGFSSDTIQNFLNGLKKGRNDRKDKIAKYLRDKGIDIDLAQVEKRAENGVVGRPHFAETMVAQGIVANRKEAFDLYLDTPEFHEVDRGKPSAETCVKMLKAAGGKVSLAHPYQIALGNDKMEDLIERLISYGLDAIECYYSRHTPEQTASYLDLAKRYHLHVTGGSDFHGEKKKPDISLATWQLDIDWLLQKD